jgi:SWI/SNF-related matrix-associated actin-dependent regulator of chromatin subfamily A-like protein 1
MQLEQLGEKSWVARSTFEERHIPKSCGFRWNPAQKVWWTDDPDKAAKLAAYAPEEVKAQLDAMAAEKEAVIAASRATDADIDIPAPEGLTYLPYQRAGIAYASQRPCSLIGDEMGLGKTIQAIGVINADPGIKFVLVVCPASLKINWSRELMKWLTRKYSIGIANGGALPATDIVIINYDILRKHRDALRKHRDALRARQWDVMIVDESHYLKNSKAGRTQEVFGKWDKDPEKRLEAIPAARKVFLTGTPIPNRPIELWPLLKSMELPDFKNWQTYVRRYCAGQRTRFGWETSGSSNLPELQEKLRSSIMVRRLKRDVLTELPPKRRQIIELPVNGSTKAVRDESAAWAARQDLIEDLRLAVELSKASDDPADYQEAVAALGEGLKTAFTEMSKLRHGTALAKVPHVTQHVIDAIDSSGKIVLFGHHKDVLYSIGGGLKEAGYKAVYLTGDMAGSDRQASVDAFQNDPTVQVIILTIGAGGVGITLTAASHVIFCELDWVPGNLSQAEDRCHRIGQENSVLVQHLVLEGSLDATIAQRIVAKQEVIDSALDRIHETIKAEPIIPSDPPASAKKSRDDLGKIAETLTAEEIIQIHQDLRILAGMCDGARAKDGAGFNRFDARIGQDLAFAPTLTPRQAALGKQITRKYRGQLGR